MIYEIIVMTSSILDLCIVLLVYHMDSNDNFNFAWIYTFQKMMIIIDVNINHQ